MNNILENNNSESNEPVKELKKRGRKKKIVNTDKELNQELNQEVETKSQLKKLNTEKDKNQNAENHNAENQNAENNNEENQNEKLDDIDKLQIEQVKKKRGRKKKWEVETTTKFIDNKPITFTEPNLNENVTDVDNENYEQKNILFGNLNIKLHSTKEQSSASTIKETLVNNKSNNNVTKCKIDITTSDLEDIDNIENKMTKKDTKVAEKTIKVMKYYKNNFESGKEIIMSNHRCYNCHHHFNNKPFFLPIEYNLELKKFKITGNFCSPNCVKSYAINSKVYSTRLYLIGQMYRQLFGPRYIIKPAPPIQCLKEYGGTLTIEEYRKYFDTDKIYMLKNICSKVVLDEIIEK